MKEEFIYPEDIKINDTYFGSPVVSIDYRVIPNTYLGVYDFILEDGSKKSLFYDQELS